MEKIKKYKKEEEEEYQANDFNASLFLGQSPIILPFENPCIHSLPLSFYWCMRAFIAHSIDSDDGM